MIGSRKIRNKKGNKHGLMSMAAPVPLKLNAERI